jgi:NDP-sugar pyrophosphorylase family protein
MDLFDLSHTLTRPLWERVSWPWGVLALLPAFVLDLGPRLGPDFEQIVPGVWVGKGTVVDPLAAPRGPAIIGRDCSLRPGAYLRASVLVGDGCELGNSSEFKNCILFDGCQVPHFSYIGDSVLGWRVHFGAGATASNFKAGGGEVSVEWEGRRVPTGLNKLGVLAGDGADVGSQAVLNPGTILGRGCVVYPLVSLRGTVPAQTIVKSADRATWVVKTARPSP